MLEKKLVGLHYCVVINKNDNPYSYNLNVIPLSSMKEDKTYNDSTCIDLGDELLSLLLNKLDKEDSKLFEKIKDFNKEKDFKKRSNIISPILKKIEYLDKIRNETMRMKHGSIAYVHQISTISKQRIFRTPILSGIHLSNESLDLIDEKIKKLFTK